jgi:hypothetical protein
VISAGQVSVCSRDLVDLDAGALNDLEILQAGLAPWSVSRHEGCQQDTHDDRVIDLKDDGDAILAALLDVCAP